MCAMWSRRQRPSCVCENANCLPQVMQVMVFSMYGLGTPLLLSIEKFISEQVHQ
jgi:hypothetical protein